MRAVWIVLAAGLIAYGSLYPFDFAMPASHADAWRTLLHHWTPTASRGDALGNLALFVPFGWACVHALGPGGVQAGRLLAIGLAGFLLAAGLQVLQVYVPARTPALDDIAWNMAGHGAGMAAGAFFGGRTRARWESAWAVPAGLIALWVVAELAPLVPSIDLQGFKDALKPLLRLQFSVADALLHGAGALLCGRALAAMTGQRPSVAWLAALCATVLAGKIVVVGQHLDASSVAGIAAGWAGWAFLSGIREPGRSGWVLGTLLLAYTVAAFAPFELAAAPRSMRWIPFSGLLEGSMLLNAQALARSLLVYAGILGLIRLSGGGTLPAGFALALWVAAVEYAQTWIAGRTGDITDPLLVLLVAATLDRVPVDGSARWTIAADAPPAPAPRAAPATGWRAWTAMLAVTCLAIALPIAVVLRLPGIPYNVAELFLAGGSLPVLFLFALAVLWTGAGPALAARWLAARPRFDAALPLAAIGIGLSALALLSVSVSEESIGDISGSSNVHWFVTNKDMWGVTAREWFLAWPWPGAIDFIERCVRFVALYGPLATFLVLMLLATEPGMNGRDLTRRMPVLLAVALPWLWLCKGIAFDWSSTDNLNELIARNGEWGWGGGGFLYGLLALVCAHAVLLARSRGSVRVLALALFVATVPLGWWLLDHGLEPRVEKYGFVFSGAQFLLGPDRQHGLSGAMLFARWAAVQVGGTLVIAAGAWLAINLPGRPRR